ncbi:MAG: DUF6089 family protein [Bacteroidales bacterium]|nr:DUF6089 family protein [Bacteroidales bacterium]
MQSFSALFVFCFIFISNANQVNAQQGLEFGLAGGGSYYMGDINLAKHFYQTKLNLGGFAKYHINGRYNIKIGAFFTNLRAADEDFNNQFQIMRDHSFETSLIELSAQFEVNFLPYEIGDVRRYSYTPYIQTGVALYLANSAQDVLNFAIPIGFGFKKNIKPQIVLGVEWAFRRTFSDYLDSLSGEDLDNYDPDYGTSVTDANRHKQSGFRYNKDWYSIALVSLSYTFKIGGLGCPAYYEY